MSIPNGLSEIKKKYGNPSANGILSQNWKKKYLTTVSLPFPMRIAGNLKKSITVIEFNKKAANALVQAFTLAYRYARIQMKKKYGYDKTTDFYNKVTNDFICAAKIDIFGGAFVFRKKRGSNKLSLHSYGIAIDINPQENAMRTKGNMPEWFIQCMKKYEFVWGGDWKSSKDPMHFQLASGA